MRLIMLLAVVLPFVLSPIAHGQDVAPAEPSDYRALIDEFVEAKSAYLVKTYSVSETEEYRALRAANDQAGIRELMESLVDPTDQFAPRMAALAEKYQGRPIEAECLLWLIMRGLGGAGRSPCGQRCDMGHGRQLVPAAGDGPQGPAGARCSTREDHAR